MNFRVTNPHTSLVLKSLGIIALGFYLWNTRKLISHVAKPMCALLPIPKVNTSYSIGELYDLINAQDQGKHNFFILFDSMGNPLPVTAFAGDRNIRLFHRAAYAEKIGFPAKLSSSHNGLLKTIRNMQVTLFQDQDQVQYLVATNQLSQEEAAHYAQILLYFVYTPQGGSYQGKSFRLYLVNPLPGKIVRTTTKQGIVEDNPAHTIMHAWNYREITVS